MAQGHFGLCRKVHIALQGAKYPCAEMFTIIYDCNTDSKMGNYNALLFLTLPSQDALLAAYLTQAMQLHRNASNRHVLVVRIEKDACRGVVHISKWV